MKYYSYTDPLDDEGIEVNKIVMSEQEILSVFWEYWCNEMKQVNLAHEINPKRCIEDWCVINWATEEDIFRFRSGHPGKVFCINEFNIIDPNFEWATVVCLNDPRVVIEGYVNLVTQMERVNV